MCYDNVDCFVNEVLKLENKRAVYFKNTMTDIVMTKKDEEHYRNIKSVDFVKKTLDLIELKIIVT